MTGGRDQILGGIRRSLGRGGLAPDQAAACDARLANPQRNLIPKRAQLPKAEQVALFIRMARALDATVDQVKTLADVPAAVADYLAQHNLPTAIRMSPDPALDRIPWSERPMLELKRGRAEPQDLVGLTPAFAGIAETGTLMLTSSPDTPATLNFMPDTHIVVLQAKDVIGAYEEGFARLRDKSRDAAGNFMPRTVNLISGPSRTADIALTLIMGAHGPRQMHIVVVDGEEG